LNNEKDKLPALLSQTQRFESGAARLGIPSAVVAEIVSLSDGTPAEDKVRAFLDNPYVLLLEPTREILFKSSSLQYRFHNSRMQDLKTRAIAAGVPKENATRLGSRDSEILATAIELKAARLTTYDPFLLFIGKEFITPETGLVVDLPDTSWLDFPDAAKGAEL
jgi:hypothetical protein